MAGSWRLPAVRAGRVGAFCAARRRAPRAPPAAPPPSGFTLADLPPHATAVRRRSQVEGLPPAPRGGHACAALGSRVLLFGGADRNPTVFDDLWVLETGAPARGRRIARIAMPRAAAQLPQHAQAEKTRDARSRASPPCVEACCRAAR